MSSTPPNRDKTTNADEGNESKVDVHIGNTGFQRDIACAFEQYEHF